MAAVSFAADQGATQSASQGLEPAFVDEGFFPVTPPSEDGRLYDDARDASAAPPSRAVDVGEEPLVAVIGVGYVGTHLVETFSRRHDTLGFDVCEEHVRRLRRSFAGNDWVALTADARRLGAATHFLVSVPTLLQPDKTVDASCLGRALRTVAEHARRGATVVIEISVAVGTTRELLGPLAKLRGLYAGMSPERVDPGRVSPPASAIPKVVSGLDDVAPGSLARIAALYSTVFDRVVPVSRPEAAEMVKLFENCQRMVCIAYANEMADACVPLGLDPWEVCRAAATKSFGYMACTPGVGVGGHCIPVNPYYLLSTSSFPLLSAASEAMARRPARIAAQTVRKLASRRPAPHGKPRVLVVGMGFKAGQSTLSNSPDPGLATHLCRSGRVEVVVADPLVPQDAVPQMRRLDDAAWNRDTLESFDTIMVVVRQVGLDLSLLDDVKGVDVEWWCM